MLESGKSMPSVDAWLREAKADSSAPACGMYLTHNGVVRATPKSEVRGVETDGVAPGHKVGGMVFGFDAEKVQAAQTAGAQLVVLRRPEEVGETEAGLFTHCQEILKWSH